MLNHKSIVSEHNPLGLPLGLRQMGEPNACGHRFGWRYVLDSIAGHSDGLALPKLCLDDFVERTFQHDDTDFVWKTPWVGIFHHPPGVPEWFDPSAPLQKILKSDRFLASLPYLRGAIVLSEHLGNWLTACIDVPVRVLKHPTGTSVPMFDLSGWTSQPRRKVVQVGWYLRNYRAIYQLPDHRRLSKVHLFQDRPWIREAMTRTDRYSPTSHRKDHGTVEVVGRLSDRSYDDLLSKSIVLCEYFDVSATNTAIECIARNTPFLVNRHPALEEYLGKNYPLFYDSIEEASSMAADTKKVREGYEWLNGLSKSPTQGDQFVRQVVEFLRELGD
ncbi:hypothetical protein AO263_15225 [Pseudomonas sp. NZIPFR-PS5]|nr:hypothetical protein AO263_15225 [Pseudomonas sp. NZIPFR-PS5]